MEFIWKVLPFGFDFPSAFYALDLLVCSVVVVADRKASKGTGGWEMARVEQGGDSVGGDSSVPAQCHCHCPCPAQPWQLETPGAVPEL